MALGIQVFSCSGCWPIGLVQGTKFVSAGFIFSFLETPLSQLGTHFLELTKCCSNIMPSNWLMRKCELCSTGGLIICYQPLNLLLVRGHKSVLGLVSIQLDVVFVMGGAFLSYNGVVTLSCISCFGHSCAQLIFLLMKFCLLKKKRQRCRREG